MATVEAAIARRWFEEVWNERRDEAIGELMARNAIGHMEGGDVHGPEEFRAGRAVFLNALPDMHITIENIVSEGDQAAVRWLVRATHDANSLAFLPVTERWRFAAPPGFVFATASSSRAGTLGTSAVYWIHYGPRRNS